LQSLAGPLVTSAFSARALKAKSFKQQAASNKRQAASLTNKDYRIIKDL